jgi:WXG100 family type VII secretion target
VTEHVASSEQMQEVVDDLQSITTALEDALAEAEQAATRLHAAWAGQAADAHRGAHDRWAADATAMNTAIAKLRTLLATARSNYDSAASTNLRMWS